MKKVLAAGIFLFMCAVTGYAYEESNQVKVASETVTRVKITNGAWTVIFSSWTDVFKSTTTTGDPKNSYNLLYYNVKNDTGADVDVLLATDNTASNVVTVTANVAWPLSDGEVESYNSPLTRWAKLYSTETSTATLIIHKNYYGTR